MAMDVEATNSSDLEPAFLLKKRRRSARKPEDDVEYEAADIERVVSEAITGCKYAEDDRKERLRVAVLDALFKRRTMKSSSQHYGVPFTTLQTYYHRSKQILASEAKQQSIIESLQEHNNYFCVRDQKSQSVRKLSDVLNRLTAYAGIDAPLAVADDITHPIGAKKRKPKMVYRVVDSNISEANAVKVDYEEQIDIQQAILNQLFDGVEASTATENSNFYSDLVDFPENFEKISDAGSSVGSKRSEKDYVYGLPIDPDDTQRIEAIERGVREVCSSSMYIGEQKDKLLNAVLMVVRGEYTINAASNMMQLPSSTVHPYVHRARSALGALLPPQASGPTFWATMKAREKTTSNRNESSFEITGCINVDKLERLVQDLVKTSLYDAAGKQKLKDAVVKVLKTGASTAEAGKTFGIPASTIQPYVNKARKAIEDGGLGQIIQQPAAIAGFDSLPGIANEEEIKEAVRAVIENGGSHSEARKEQLFAAVTAAVSGKVTIKEACHQADLPPSTAHPYVSKARHLLGARCPERKGIAPSEQFRTAPKSNVISAKKKSLIGTGSEEVPLSVRSVSRMLCETKFDVLAAEFKGTEEDLKTRIAKIIQRYNYKGNPDIMCDAIAKVFLEGRTLADVCASHNLAQTTLSTYVRLMKAHIKQELEKENEDVSNPAEKAIHDAVKPSVLLHSPVKKLKHDIDFGVDQPQSTSVPSEESLEASICSEDDEKLLSLANVMMLHSSTASVSQEYLLKVLIAYLLKQQYRRSPEAQEKMRMCLENVLLDGLSLNETLKIHKGLTEHVLQVYLTRVRSAMKCITTDYPIFLEECVSMIKKCDFSRLNQDSVEKVANARTTRRVNTTSSATITSSPTKKRAAKRLLQSDEEEAANLCDPVCYVSKVLSEPVLEAVASYLSKLVAINFPIENSLIIGLAKIVHEEVPVEYRHSISEGTWNAWVTAWRKEHLQFTE